MRLLIIAVWTMAAAWLPAFAGAPQPVLQGDAAHVLAAWFGVDKTHPPDVRRTALGTDALGERFRLEFEAGDGQRVNGVLAMPAKSAGTPRLALALHPMGRDHSIWWDDAAPVFGGKLTARLRTLGYAVLSLDARCHGERPCGSVGIREIVARAHSDNPRLYHDMIVGSVRDYRLALRWAERQDDLDAGVALEGRDRHLTVDHGGRDLDLRVLLQRAGEHRPDDGGVLHQHHPVRLCAVGSSPA